MNAVLLTTRLSSALVALQPGHISILADLLQDALSVQEHFRFQARGADLLACGGASLNSCYAIWTTSSLNTLSVHHYLRRLIALGAFLSAVISTSRKSIAVSTGGFPNTITSTVQPVDALSVQCQQGSRTGHALLYAVLSAIGIV